jgi:hypothetical protein
MEPSDLREELRQKFSEICEENGAPLPPELAHYTSPSGFNGIITSRHLWCTDICDVRGDPEEGDYGMEIVKSVVRRKPVPVGFRQKVGSAKHLFGLKDIVRSYVSCFYSGPEQPCMWKEYAVGGTGCAVVFDYKELLAGAQEGRRYALIPMLYDCEAQVFRVERIVDHAIELQRIRSLSSSEADKFWIEEVAFSLFNCGMMFKKSKYFRERESRIVVFDPDNVNVSADAQGRSHVPIPFERTAVVRVVRGPQNSLQPECLREILRQAGYLENLPIVNTECRFENGSGCPVSSLPS